MRITYTTRMGYEIDPNSAVERKKWDGQRSDRGGTWATMPVGTATLNCVHANLSKQGLWLHCIFFRGQAHFLCQLMRITYTTRMGYEIDPNSAKLTASTAHPLLHLAISDQELTDRSWKKIKNGMLETTCDPRAKLLGIRLGLKCEKLTSGLANELDMGITGTTTNTMLTWAQATNMVKINTSKHESGASAPRLVILAIVS